MFRSLKGTRQFEARAVFNLQEQPKKEFRDRSLCFKFQRYGNCAFGDNCRFVHEVSQGKPNAAAATEKKPTTPPRPKKEEAKVQANTAVVDPKPKGTHDDLFMGSVSIVDGVSINSAQLESEVDLTLAWDSGSGSW